MAQQQHLPQTPRDLIWSRKVGLPVGIAIASGLLWFFTAPLAQDTLYHKFADQRTMLGIPHALNVLSNIPFSLAGIWGCVLILRRRVGLSNLDLIYLVFFFGVFFTGLGSSYYHLSPDNATLVWDRLPMTVGFMAFTCLVTVERYSTSLGRKAFPWLLVVGFLSVVYWAWLDDLRPYFAIQFGPMLILPVIIWRYSGPGTRWLWLTIAFYFLAKALELADHEVFEATGGLFSGHTLKHLAAAAGASMIVAKVAMADKETA